MWYKSGSVTVTNGSDTVTGVGTYWQENNLQAGDAFIDIRTLQMYEILEVKSDSELKIYPAFIGENGSNIDYSINPYVSGSTTAQLAKDIRTLIDKYQNRIQISNAIPADGTGTHGDIFFIPKAV